MNCLIYQAKFSVPKPTNKAYFKKQTLIIN